MTPRTKLDTRYSDDTATAVDWSRVEERLARTELAWLVTVRSSGRPHATPVVPVWRQHRMYFHTGEREQKYLNLQSNPRVLILVGDGRWDSGLDVAVEGVAARVTDEAVLRVVADLITKRWDGRWRLDVADGGFSHPGWDGVRSVVFEVSPTKGFAHAKGDPFGQTNYGF